jgi:hypothetical protein
MANERDYPNSGILFKNDRKRTDKDPGFTGNGDLECPHCASRFQFFINGWLKEGRKGKFFSFSFKPKGDAPTARNAQPPAAADDDDFPSW